MHRSKKHGQSGNALFLVFIAVILFAALGFAVSRNSGSAGTMTRNKADIAAAEITDYTLEMQRHVTRMVNVKGVSETELDFGRTITYANGTTAANYVGNPNCTTNSCRVYIEKGGQFQAKDFTMYAGVRTAAWLDTWQAMGVGTVNVISINGVGTSKPDLVYRIPGILNDVCKAINRRAGLIDSPISGLTGTYTNFYTAASVTELNGTTSNSQTIGFSDTTLKGKTYFCINDTLYGNFYSVILAR